MSEQDEVVEVLFHLRNEPAVSAEAAKQDLRAAKVIESQQQRIRELEQQIVGKHSALRQSALAYDRLREQLAARDAVLVQVDDWFNDLGETPCPDGETLARILDAAPESVLAGHDAEKAHGVAEMIRRHATPPSELANPKSDALLAWVADWIEGRDHD